MESIRELRQICQAPRKSVDNWHIKHIGRPFSVYITWLLLHTPITANGATFLFVLIGLAASAVFIVGTRASFLVGSFLLEVWYIFDMVDGEIARYRKQASLTGVYFDYLSHYIVHPFLFFCIGVGLYIRYNHSIQLFLVALGAGYSVTMISLSSEVMASTLYDQTKRFLLPGDSYLHPEAAVTLDAKDDKKDSFTRIIFSSAHSICTFPLLMNIIFVAALIDSFSNLNVVMWLIVFFALCATMVWLVRISIFIVTKKIDREYAGLKQASSFSKVSF